MRFEEIANKRLRGILVYEPGQPIEEGGAEERDLAFGAKPVIVRRSQRPLLGQTERDSHMEALLTVEGVVLKVLPGTMFHVELPNKRQVLAHISGKMRKRFIRLCVGDRVKMEMTPYDIEKARIVYRLS